MKMKRPLLSFYLMCIYFLVLTIIPLLCVAEQMSPGPILPKPPAPPVNSKQGDIIPGRYIVKFKGAPLAAYKGDVPGFPPTNPEARGEKTLDMSHPDSVGYLNHLQESNTTAYRKMERTLERSIDPSKAFRVVFNGMVVNMSPDEARLIKKLPEVADVIPDKRRYSQTDNGPSWIGADTVWSGSIATATKGEGIVIGIIDSGINPANPSFADVGDDGYNHTNPRGQYYGFCDSGNPDYNASFQCNDKLIGAYDFARNSGEPAVLYDNDGHGSHTAGTAAGNVVDPAALNAPTLSLERTISGVAPHSNIISYKATRGGHGATSWLVAAIEQATVDGVDVINYSIGGDAYNPWDDLDSEAFLNARQAGIFVATSAGNNGPDEETLGSPGNSPWMMTVGNCSHDRKFKNSLTNLTRTGGSLPDIEGGSITSALPKTGIVYAGNYGDALCLAPFTSGTFSGQIVVCDRGNNGRVEKGQNVLAGGAGGYVLANSESDGNYINTDAHALPAVHIGYDDGVALKNWLASGSNHQAAISGTTIDEKAANGDIMSADSSRGPNGPLPEVIKPDVSAPGNSILAAFGSGNEIVWGVLSGTSMASPHAAGAAALLKALYPGWSPAEIQSALMTTADSSVLKEDAVTPADPFDTGSGRIDVGRAVQAGILLDETYTNYLNADPSKGGDPKTLNLPSLGDDRTVMTTTWQRTLTSSLDVSMGWNATVANPSGVSLTVDPSYFTLPAGGSRKVTITANAGSTPYDIWSFGSVTFTPTGAGAVSARLPVAIKRAPSNFPNELHYDRVSRRSSSILEDLRAIAITGLTVSYYGLVGANVDEEELYQDPTPDDSFDGTYDPGDGDGLWVKHITVPANTKRLVTEIVKTESPDIDMYLYRWTGSKWESKCSSDSSGSDEYCSILNPEAGDYYLWIQNYTASDPSGGKPDEIHLATAVISGSSAGNLTVGLAGGGSSVSAGQPFDMEISWNLTSSTAHWYGRFGVGTDPGHPNNLGFVDLDLHTAIKANPALFLLLDQ